MSVRLRCLGSITAIALLSAATAPLAGKAPAQSVPQPQGSQPLLATPDQVEAEKTLLALIADPELKAIQNKLKAELAKTAIGQTTDGAARLDFVIAQWTNSHIFKEIITNRTTPALIWGTDDTPREWLGHHIGGAGTSGDNPDFIYRSTALDGNGRYEIVGHIDPRNRPEQIILSVSGAQLAAAPLHKNRADLGNQVALLTDRDLAIAPDGSFRVTLGGTNPDDSPNHIAIPPAPVTVGFRDVLSDWNQRPIGLAIRRTDGTPAVPLNKADVRQRVLANLESYVRYWSSFPESWFGGLQPNSLSGPVSREGGWGFLAGLRFDLKPDEAFLVTTTPAGASYAGIQIVDPWMIASDARKYQNSLNLAQATPNADGSYTFVIAPRDPGIANWLDSTGLHQGFAVLRWQGFPASTVDPSLVREFRVIKLADAARLPGVSLATPQQRQAQIAQRAIGYTNRVR